MTEAVSLSLSHKAQQPEQHCVRSERAASVVNYHDLCMTKVQFGLYAAEH